MKRLLLAMMVMASCEGVRRLLRCGDGMLRLISPPPATSSLTSISGGSTRPPAPGADDESRPGGATPPEPGPGPGGTSSSTSTLRQSPNLDSSVDMVTLDWPSRLLSELEGGEGLGGATAPALLAVTPPAGALVEGRPRLIPSAAAKLRLGLGLGLG